MPDARPKERRNDLSKVEALIFDVFGTVVNWRDSIIAEVAKAATEHGMPDGDWGRFADEWRAWYGKSTRELSSGDGPWRLVDEIHREKLDVLLEEYGLADVMNEEAKQHLNRAWHRLDGWPDSPGGLRRLKSKFIIATASNGNLALLVNMAKHADLPWDAVMSPDVYGAYKPSPKVYNNATKLLGLNTDQVMMVAAHVGDLEAASRQGLATGFVYRPFEHGSENPVERPDTSSFDVSATDFDDMANQLGCA